MTLRELTMLARDVVDNFHGDEYWIFKAEATADVAVFARSVINMALEEAAIELDKLERGVYTTAQTPSGLVRAMRVK
jgi:hypothetical protein